MSSPDHNKVFRSSSSSSSSSGFHSSSSSSSSSSKERDTAKAIWNGILIQVLVGGTRKPVNMTPGAATATCMVPLCMDVCTVRLDSLCRLELHTSCVLVSTEGCLVNSNVLAK